MLPHKDLLTECIRRDSLHLKFNALTCTHTHFLFPPLSCDRICPLFIFFEGALGRRASLPALGTDMNKWTVLHSSMKSTAKHPKQEILHPLSKGLLKRLQLQVQHIWSGSCTHACPSPHVFPRAFCECMHRMHRTIHRNTSFYMSDPTKSLFCPSELQQTKWTVPKTQAMEKYWKGVFQNRKLIFDSNTDH